MSSLLLSIYKTKLPLIVINTLTELKIVSVEDFGIRLASFGYFPGQRVEKYVLSPLGVMKKINKD